MAFSTRFRFRNLPRFLIGSLGDMWYRATNGDLTPVAGTKAPGKSPVIQADNTVAWDTVTARADDAIAAALRVDGDARIREAGLTATSTAPPTAYDPTAGLQADADARVRESGITTSSSLDELQVQLIAQFYGA